jgi:LysM repeat protein
MGIFDSIKNALGQGESEADTTVAPSQMLRDAGIDPSALKFGFGANSITISGQVPHEAERQKILGVLAGAPGITTVQDNLTVAPPASAPTQAAESEPAEAEPRTYTVQSGDTLWKIAEQQYGNGSNYMKIF